MNIYFDDMLINDDCYKELSINYIMFSTTFCLGATPCASLRITLSNIEDISFNKVYIKDDNDNYIFELNLTKKIYNDDNSITYELSDNMILFEFNYDASDLIHQFGRNVTLAEILQDICSKANIDSEVEILENEVSVNWFDNTISARKYIGYIAELQGCYAYINSSGSLAFSKYKKDSNLSIDFDSLSNIKIGKGYNISRVVYEFGATKYEYGNESGDTLNIDSDNPFVTNANQIEYVYNQVNGLNFNNITVNNMLLDSLPIIGDLITFTDSGNNYLFINQFSGSFFKKWNLKLNLDVEIYNGYMIDVTQASDNYKKISQKVDRYNNILMTTVAETIPNIQEDIDGTPTYKLLTNYTIGDTIPENTIYEYINDEYILTQDTTYQDNKQYFILEMTGGLNQKVSSVTEQVNYIQTNTYTKTQIQEITGGNGYFLTKDLTYQKDTKYYEIINNKYVLKTDYTAGDEIPTNTIYEFGSIRRVSSEEVKIDADGMKIVHTNEEGEIDSATEGTFNQNGVSLKEVINGIVGDEIFFSGYVTDTRYGNEFKGKTLVYVLNAIINGYLYVANNTGRIEEWTDEEGNTGPAMFLM